MTLILSAFVDPTLQCCYLCGVQVLAALFWGHVFVVIVAQNAFDDFAFIRFAWNEPSRFGFATFQRGVTDIEPVVALAFVVVRPVALEAHIRKDGADIPVKLEFLGGLRLG